MKIVFTRHENDGPELGQRKNYFCSSKQQTALAAAA